MTTRRGNPELLSLTELRLVDNNKAIGIMTPQKALQIAKECEMTLVEVSPSAKPPVWKLLPSEVVKAESSQPVQRDKHAKTLIRRQAKPGKQPKALKVKEVRVRDNCDIRDLETKARAAQKFLAKGHVVKVVGLNAGRVDEETGKARAHVMVDYICDACASTATSSGAAGKLQAGNQPGNKNILGIITSVLTPRKASTLDGSNAF